MDERCFAQSRQRSTFRKKLLPSAVWNITPTKHVTTTRAYLPKTTNTSGRYLSNLNRLFPARAVISPARHSVRKVLTFETKQSLWSMAVCDTAPAQFSGSNYDGSGAGDINGAELEGLGGPTFNVKAPHEARERTGSVTKPVAAALSTSQDKSNPEVIQRASPSCFDAEKSTQRRREGMREGACRAPQVRYYFLVRDGYVLQDGSAVLFFKRI